MASYKALAIANRIKEELTLRGVASVSQTFDSAQNPMVLISNKALIRIKNVDSLFKDGIGLPQTVYTPHTVQLMVEAGQAWTALLPLIGTSVLVGAALELWETAAGNAPDESDFAVAGNKKASFASDALYPLMAQQ
jgi:hypothetical protein